MLRTLIIIGAGSFIGGVARFLLTRFVQTNVHPVFPWGTMAVNVAGCLFIGILYGLFERGNLMNPELRMFLTIGFCGGFTTFSTFVNENYLMLSEHNYLQFSGYALLSLALGLAAVYLGHLIVRAI